jgi:hypothetical protein
MATTATDNRVLATTGDCGAADGRCAGRIGGLFVPGGHGGAAHQLPVSTVSSIVTFVMVFVIQSSQNRDSRALQTKVDAMASVPAVMAKERGVEGNEYLLTRLPGLEDAPEREIDRDQALVRQSAAYDWSRRSFGQPHSCSISLSSRFVLSTVVSNDRYPVPPAICPSLRERVPVPSLSVSASYPPDWAS